MAVFRFLLKWILGIQLLGFFWGITHSIIPRMVELSGDLSTILLSSIIILTNLFIFILGEHRFDFVRILKHEITHALFAMVSGKNVYSLSATRKKGGVVRMDEGNVLIALSPYVFPVGTWIIICLAFILNARDNIILIILSGLTFGFHIHSVFKDFHPSQPDIRESGVIYSLLMTICGNGLTVIFLLVAFSGLKLPAGKIIAGAAQDSIQIYIMLAVQIKKIILVATNSF